MSYSVSGVALEQMQKETPEVMDTFRDLASTGGVEFLAETYYHSLAAIFSEREFQEQVWRQVDTIKRLFGYTPRTFRNTELTYHDHLAYLVQNLGYKTILTEGLDWLIGQDGSGKMWKAPGRDIKVMCRNYRLSDDIAFRFSAGQWSEYPLYADKWAAWVHACPGPLVNIFIDYETFGEHHWKESGIFDFLNYLPDALLKYDDLEILTPAEAAENTEPMGEIRRPTGFPGPTTSATFPHGSGTICSATPWRPSIGWKTPSRTPTITASLKTGGGSQPPTTSTTCPPKGPATPKSIPTSTRTPGRTSLT